MTKERRGTIVPPKKPLAIVREQGGNQQQYLIASIQKNKRVGDVGRGKGQGGSS